MRVHAHAYEDQNMVWRPNAASKFFVHLSPITLWGRVSQSWRDGVNVAERRALCWQMGLSWLGKELEMSMEAVNRQ